MKIINIQFLRAIAALLVVFYHTSAHFFVVGGEQSGNIFSFISNFGYIGVDIFLLLAVILCGFLHIKLVDFTDL